MFADFAPPNACIGTSNYHDNMNHMFKRTLQLLRPGTETFFLWGSRQTGKTTLLKATYPDALWIDLLKAEEYRRYLQNPELLRGELVANKSIRQVVIDEVQKVPSFLTKRTGSTRTVIFALPCAGQALARSSAVRPISWWPHGAL